MKKRFWLMVDLLLRKFKIGKEPAEAYSLTRGEQLRLRVHIWVGKQEWLPLGISTAAQMRSVFMAAMAWPRSSPVNIATEAEMRKISNILSPTSEAYKRFGMRPAMLADFGKEKPTPQFPEYYSEPVKVPTYWELVRGRIIDLALRWICRR